MTTTPAPAIVAAPADGEPQFIGGATVTEDYRNEQADYDSDGED